MSIIPLNSLEPGSTGIIKEFSDNPRFQSRLMEMGILPGEEVRMIKKTPFHGPLEIKIRSFYLFLRWEDATEILVSQT